MTQVTSRPLCGDGLVGSSVEAALEIFEVASHRTGHRGPIARAQGVDDGGVILGGGSA